MRSSLFDELRAQFNPPAPPPRLKPNLFARAARFVWDKAGFTIVFWAIIACLGMVLAVALAQVPATSRLPVPITTANSPNSTSEFAGLGNLQTIYLANSDVETLITQRADLLAALRDQSDIYDLVFAPGANEFYDDNGMLFRPLDEIKARVAYALSLKPLFDAIAQAPNAQSMTTLVNEIAGSVQQGRKSQGVSDMLNEAAISVQALIGGEDKPMDWAKIAELDVPDTAQSVTILVLPKPGQEIAARVMTTKLLDLLQNSSSTKTQLLQAQPIEAKAVPLQSDRLRVLAASFISLALIVLLLAVFMGKVRLVLFIFAPTLITLPVVFAAFMYFEGSAWASFWPAIFSVVFCLLLTSLHLAFVLAGFSEDQPMRQTTVMLAGQSQGWRVVMFGGCMLAPWLIQIFARVPFVTSAAVLASAAIFLGLCCVFTLSLAVLRFSPSILQWPARDWLEPAHQALFETRYWQILAPAFGILIVLGCFGLAVTSSSPATSSQLDAAVNIIARDRQEVETSIARLKAFSGAQSVRWLGMFLPEDVDAKRTALRELGDKFPHITPVQSEAPQDLRDQIDAMQENLKRIASISASDNELASAANQFRRSLALLEASDREQPITQLENRLFGGFNRLADRASQLASLKPIDFESLPAELRRLFGHGNGPFRLEVTTSPGTTNEQLAISLQEAGFNVMHPAASQTLQDSQRLRTLIRIFGLAAAATFVSLFVTFRTVKQWLTLILFTAVTVVVAIGVDAVWQPERDLSWLLGAITLFTCFGGLLTMAMARENTSAESVVETFLLPSMCLATAAAFYGLGIEAVSAEIVPLTAGIFILALVVGLFHHHGRAALQDE